MKKRKYSFLREPLGFVKQMSSGVNQFIDKVNDAENNIKVTYNFDGALEEYHKMQPECVDEFCANYSFGYCILHSEVDSPEYREKYYLKLREYIFESLN